MVNKKKNPSIPYNNMISGEKLNSYWMLP